MGTEPFRHIGKRENDKCLPTAHLSALATHQSRSRPSLPETSLPALDMTLTRPERLETCLSQASHRTVFWNFSTFLHKVNKIVFCLYTFYFTTLRIVCGKDLLPTTSTLEIFLYIIDILIMLWSSLLVFTSLSASVTIFFVKLWTLSKNYERKWWNYYRK